MNITIITGNSERHKYLIKILSHHNLKLIIEKKKNFSYLFNNKQKISIEAKNYFKKVLHAEKKIFGKIILKKKMYKKKIVVEYGELNDKNFSDLKSFLESDLFIVFGSSFIKGSLAKFLYEKKCINIHMGISPYYKGTNCNFWATIDGNFHLVGATVHLLSKKIDGGPILYHSVSKPVSDSNLYSMKNVKSVILSLKQKIDNNSLLKIKPREQKKNQVIRYTKNKDIGINNFRKYPNKVKKFSFNKKLLIKPVMMI